MSPFWIFAKGMFRDRAALIGSVAFAFISAGSMGGGLVAIAPVLKTLLEPGGRSLQDLAREQASKGPLKGRIPESILDAIPTDPFQGLVLIIVGLGVLTVIGGTANFLHQFLSLTVVQRTVTRMRRDLFHKVIRLPLKDIVTDGPSDTISRIVNDTAAVGGGLTALVSKALSQVTKGIAAFIAALILDWRLTLVSLIVAPLLYTVIRKLGKRIRRASRAALEQQSGLYAATAEALQGLRVVKVHTTERYESGRFHRINKEAMKQAMRVRTARALASPLVEVLTIVVLGGLALVAFKAILDGKLNASDFLGVFIALGAAGASIKPLTGLSNDIQQSYAAADRVMALLRAAPEQGHDPALKRLSRHGQSIEFRDVRFAYPNALRPAIDGVNLRIEHGETIAVVGPNGCGKTTLLALVPRLFEPQEGRIEIDGHDIATVSVRSLRRQIGVVTQETVLFRGTIRSNIAYGAENVTEERILDAARRARADDFIRKLPRGYDTPVGEQGLTLSGGQRQRIAIARAILRDPAILILDEATSMIDADSEAKIAEAVAEFSHGRTCLIVAHRLSTVVNADRIVVMDGGKVVDVGRHDELLERCEVYQLIARKQLVPA
ncbi:MAG: ABC transporter ATP-binding protein [Phycisphaeraceae bacterium]|nr:ABC transporter ATP-binding protein [Phycisphaeraceae bacterium]MCW5769827.1 ABC transporter ATP-binding protein [Phycisphaeraceae bacterium]